MAFVRVYTGPDSETHFEELDMTFAPADLGPLTDRPAVSNTPVHILPEKVEAVIFGRQSLARSPDPQAPTGQRHYELTLAGEFEIEVGSGEVRRFGPGDVVLMEDVTGRGHIGRVLSEPFIWAVIKLAK